MTYPYQLLGLRPGAGPDEVKRAYRALARRYHPDVNAAPEATRRFLQITEAYRQVLHERESAIQAMQATVAAENLYYRHRPRTAATPPLVVDPDTTTAGSPTASVPRLLRWVMDSLVGMTSLFLIVVPFLVYYQLSAKGLDGWPSLAFFPLVIGGTLGIYQTVRAHYRLAS